MSKLAFFDILADSYKLGHADQMPNDIVKLYENMTPRTNKYLPDVPVVFSANNPILVQHVITKIRNMVSPCVGESHQEKALTDFLNRFTGPNGSSSIISRWNKLGKFYKENDYLPLMIKTLPVGSFSEIGCPVLTITNTHPDFAWLVGFIEDMCSITFWPAITRQSICMNNLVNGLYYAEKTGCDPAFVKWMFHDFSMRGLGNELEVLEVGEDHLTFFYGTDNLYAANAIVRYNPNIVCGSVPATEHMVMCLGGQETEKDTIERIINTYPAGIVSVVSDTWDYWNVLTETLPALKDKIENRAPDAFGNAKFVVRPDSGDPFDIIFGDPYGESKAERIGTLNILMDTFGYTVNDKGFKVLNPKVGIIYGDGITTGLAEKILRTLCEMKVCVSCIVFGVGSYSYRGITRDSLGFALKATYAEKSNGESVELFKNPKTAKGFSKKSHKGLIQVNLGDDGVHWCRDQVTADEESSGALITVYDNGFVDMIYHNFEETRTIVDEAAAKRVKYLNETI